MGSFRNSKKYISKVIFFFFFLLKAFHLLSIFYLSRKAETDPAAKPKLADALIRLAEVAIESENYTSAIEDLQKCLEIQKASFPADSRF